MMITEIAKRLGFPEEDITALTKAYAAMSACKGWKEAFAEASDRVFGVRKGAFREALEDIAHESGVHPHTADMVLLLLCARPMRYLYAAKGIGEDIYYDTLADLRYKLEECKKVFGICGTFVGWWFPDYYTCRRFALGRLQYEAYTFPHEDYKGIVKAGATVLNCHIPASGSLLHEDVIRSLKKAYEFYPELIRNGILPVYCSSWLLYPPTAELYGKSSNLRKFFDLFDTIKQEENPTELNFWRVFNRPYAPEALADAPEDTSMQRAFKKYLLEGKKMGCGKSILLFDGEKVLDK